MKALSIRQPYASLIAQGLKRYETRAFRPWRSVIGERIAIHASSVAAVPEGALAAAFERVGLRWEHWPLGCVIATGVLSAVVATEIGRPDPLERLCGDWTPGRWAWRISEVLLLDRPIPASGTVAPLFWDWDPPAGVETCAAGIETATTEPTVCPECDGAGGLDYSTSVCLRCGGRGIV